MTSLHRFAQCATVVLGMIALLWGQLAFAREDGRATPTPAEARQRLAERLATLEVGQVPPLLSNPADAALLRNALDPSDLPPVTASDLGTGLDSCDVANRYNVTLMFIGSRKDELKGTTPEDAARIVAERARVNAVRYQDELALSLRFTAACMARLVAPSAAFWDSLAPADRTQIRLDGLRQVRRGMANVYIGLVMTQADPSSRPSNKALMLDALLADNARLGQGLTPDDRRRVLDAINSYLPGVSGDARTGLVRLRDELAALPCLQLCPL
jgi:hypothetical protein